MAMISAMPVKAVACRLDEHDIRLRYAIHQMAAHLRITVIGSGELLRHPDPVAC
jgi:hypothetical protein